MTTAAFIDWIAAPLDRIRREVFRYSIKVPALRGVLLRRDSRVKLLGSVHALIALCVAIYFPVFGFLMGPIVFGVAHVAADVRYLVVRQSLAGWWRRAILWACLSLLVLRVYAALTHARIHDAELLIVSVWALLGIVAATRSARSHWQRSLLGSALVVVLLGVGLVWPRQAEMVLLHAHNLVALLAWLWLFRPRTLIPWWPLALIVLGCVALSLGLFVTQSFLVGMRFQNLHVLQVAEWVAPGLSFEYAVGVTCAYVFLQSVHYATWLYYIPQQALTGEAPATFRASAHGAVRDFGQFGSLAVVVAIAGVLAACGVWGIQFVRHTYVSVATFHVYLELVLLVYLWVAGRAAEGALERRSPAAELTGVGA